MRRLLAGTISVVTSLILIAGPASGAAPANRTSDVSYSVSATDRNGWSMSARGDIRFYSGFRQFKIFGDVVINRGSEQGASGYVAVKQNIANTQNDGRWYTIAIGAHADRYLDTDEWIDGVWYGFVGRDDSGEYFAWATTAGRGLKGVWVRVCHPVEGPDVCGRKSYIDNPYVTGTAP